MQNDSVNSISTRLQDVDYYCVIRDVFKNIIYIILGALACAMIANVVATEQYSASYTTSATFTVSVRGSSNYAYANLSSAQTSATTFSNILNSSIMHQLVCEDLNMSSFDAQASASVIDETNLLVLTVTADSPKKAYSVIRSIMANYSEIAASLTSSSMMEVLEEPEVPVHPDTAISTMAVTRRVFIYGLILFVLLFVLSSILNDTIKSENDVSGKLDTRCLGTIYFEKKHKTVSSRLHKKNSGLLVTNPSSSFAFVESYKKIAARLTYTLPEDSQSHDGRIIVVTSVLENEGKSTASSNIALTLAKNPAKVLLIDGDLRKPAQHLLFQTRVPDDYTLPALLEGSADLKNMLRYDKKRDIYLLFSNNHYDNSTEIIASARMRNLLNAFRKYFDYIVIDSPPMSLMADSEVMADFADMSVLVVRYNYVQAEDINDAIDVLNGCNSVLAGCILNQVKTAPVGISNGYSGYGGYGGYGNYKTYAHYAKTSGGEDR